MCDYLKFTNDLACTATQKTDTNFVKCNLMLHDSCKVRQHWLEIVNRITKVETVCPVPDPLSTYVRMIQPYTTCLQGLKNTMFQSFWEISNLLRHALLFTWFSVKWKSVRPTTFDPISVMVCVTRGVTPSKRYQF